MRYKFRYWVEPTEELCGYYITSDQKGFEFFGDHVVIKGWGLVGTDKIEQFVGEDEKGEEIYERH